MQVPLNLHDSDEVLTESSKFFSENEKIEELMSGRISSITFGKACGELESSSCPSLSG